MEESRNNSASHKGGNHLAEKRTFRKAALMLSIVVLIGLVSQNIYQWVGLNAQVAGLDLLVGVVVFIGMAALVGKPIFRIIDNPPFNVTNLIFIALATALGTFVPQQTDPANGGLVGLLRLNDIFHSWWYVSFYGLLAMGLIKISSKKKFNRENIGFHLAHLSPILVLCGFWVDYFLGFRGIIKLEEGQQKNTVLLYKGHSGYIHDSTTLDFNIRLDHFEFEKYQPDYRIQIWKQDDAGHAVKVSQGDNHAPEPPQIIASLPLEQGKIHRIYGTDMRFRLSEFYPDFEFDYQYPLITDTIEAKDPGILIDLKTPEGDAFVQLRANQTGRNKLADLVNLGAWLEFYWELPGDLARGLNLAPVPADLAKENRIIFEGKNRKIYFLMDSRLTEQPLETKQFHPIPGKDSIGFSIRYLMPDVAYLQTFPSSKSKELNNPVARVEVWKKGGPAQNAYLYPASPGGKGGMYSVPGTIHFLAMESLKDKETKYYKSEVSVLDLDGELVKQQSIKVNEPMLHKGYRFYQTDYDPNNPSYSGIGVSHEPGLMVIYLGFFLLVAGVTHMFYIKKSQVH